jgi:hypothetical protein
MAAEMVSGRRRVFVEDARRNGQFLRVTWHAERQQFVVSNWEDTLCVGATRVPVAKATELIGVLVEGLADVTVHPPSAVATPQSLRAHLRAWWRERSQRAPVLRVEPGTSDRLTRSA